VLQGKLRVVVAAAESHAAVVAEHDASNMLITVLLEKALGDEMAASLALAQAKAATADTIHVFRGLTIQVRPTLAALGLELPLIPSEPDGSIALWFADVIEQIGSLPKRLRQMLRTEGEHVVNLVGCLILTRMHRFAPNFPFTQIFERFRDDAPGRAAKETNQALWPG
jgi:hypothetical protein